MKYLVVVATESEIASLRKTRPDTEILVTGVGMVATAYHLGRALALQHYDFVLNLGIAGSFDRTFAIGDVVQVIEEQLVEMGVEDGDKFIPLWKPGRLSKQDHIFQNPYYLPNLPCVRGATVNTVTGTAETVQKILDRTHPQIETMEGAAAFYACLKAAVRFAGVRAISNYVEPREKSRWNIPLAVANLNRVAFEIMSP